MNEKKKSKETFKFKYKFADDYNPTYVNGAFGGISTKKEIVINFFLERPGVPRYETHEILGDRLSNDVIWDPEDQHKSAVRYVDTGIVLSLESAKSINEWLTTKIKDLEKVMQQEEKTKKKNDNKK